MALPTLRCARFDIPMKSAAQSLCAIVGLLLATAPGTVAQTDLSSQYLWQSVRIGGGGFVVGMVIHPLDPTVRYARTDVGNAYRWNNRTQQWIPMRVSNSDGTGVQSATEVGAPSSNGEDSVAVDPTNTNVVYMVFPAEHSCDVQCPTNFVEIYKSTDGGQTFTPGNMEAAGITGNPNGANRADGERLAVDPGNSAVLYYGSDSQGLYRSLDGGMTWTQFGSGDSSGLPTNVEFVNVQFAKGPGTATVNGIVMSKTIYAVSINNGGDTGGDVYESLDGGQTWADVSTGVKDTVSGESLSHQALSTSIDAADSLYVVENFVTNGGLRAYWKFSSGKWTRVSLQGSINQALTSVVVDPTNAQRIYAMGADTSLARSDDGGATWINLGSPQYANTLGWLPQTVGMNGGEWHSNGGLKLDSAGNLWSPTGQEGPITISAASASSATASNPPRWTIVSAGIEEMVAMDITVPPGSSDTIVATAMDTTGFYIPDPDNFSAMQIPLQQEIISQGTSAAYAPDAPSYIAVTSSNVGSNGTNYSGYSTNGGKNWMRFGSMPQFRCGANKCDIPAGMIAVSARGTRTLGSDHLVIYPPEGFAPQSSQDGGASWRVTKSFPLNADGLTINTADYNSFLYPQINQHLLRADPFTPDKFYLKFTHAPDSLYISTDGGITWQGQPNASLPDWAWYGQLAANGKVPNDFWYADGWAGSTTHGLFHSTDGGQTFQQLPGISHAIVVAIGAGSGQAGNAPYTVYFYGLMTSDSHWGIFRSTDGGGTWARISYYPTGIYDVPHAMTASQDTFGKVYVGFSGNSFVYGQIASNGTEPPGAPTELSAIAISGTEIDLSWIAPLGSLTGYNVYRGTSAGGESATPIASGLTATTYTDTALAAGTEYFYKVTAANANGEGPASNEASASATQPSIALATAAGASNSATVSAGQTATFQLALTSINYSGIITFSCAGAPAGDTCTVPAPLNINPTTTTVPVTVSVQTHSAVAQADHTLRWGMLPLAAGVFSMPFCFGRKRRFGLIILIAAAAGLLTTAGCGSGSNATTQPNPVASTLTVSASGQNVKMATVSLTLTVQ